MRVTAAAGTKPLEHTPLYSTTRGTQPFVGPLVSADMVSSCPELGIVSNLRFCDPKYIRAGTIHCHSLVSEHLLADFNNCNNVKFVRDYPAWGRDGTFFPHFKGTFKQQSYDMASPSPILFKYSPSCAKFSDFIGDKIVQWVESAAVSI